MTDLIGMSDTVIRPVVVDPEGTPREYTISDFVCITSPDGGKLANNASDCTHSLVGNSLFFLQKMRMTHRVSH